MSTCTVCNRRSNISVKLPSYVPDKKLAFVENVCLRLIEDRFGPFYFAEPWPETQVKTASQLSGELARHIDHQPIKEPLQTPEPFSGGLARRLRRQLRNAGKPAAELAYLVGKGRSDGVSTGNAVTGDLQSAIPRTNIYDHESRFHLPRARGSPIFNL